MAHGAGGKATQSLIEGLFVPAFGGDTLSQMADAGELAVDGVELALTTDSFVVKPLRFPGGSIGELAVNGTVNDLAVAGARPLALTLSLMLEEGLAAEELRAEVDAIARAARAAGVEIVAGDTKVVERGHADGMYICTTGLGGATRARACRPRHRSPAIASSCPAASASTAWRSCSRAANSSSTPRSSPTRARCGRRSTRCWTPPGRRCAACATPPAAAWPRCSTSWRAPPSVAMLVREAAIPVHPAVAGAAEILGIDPMYVANEGRLVAFVAPERPTARSRRCARSRAASRRRRSARCGRSRPGWCWWRRALAAGG